MSRVVAFDVGKSGCRVALFVDRRRVASAEHPSSLALADRGGAHRAIAAMTDVMGDLPGHLIRARTPVDAVGAGVAGLSQAPDALEEIADQLADRHPGSVVALSSDMTTSHLGALGGRPGVVVAAGTGAVSLSVSPAGESARVDGWGYLLGDCGSGYDIARRGLDSALRAHDGRSGSDVLRRLATERFGDLDQLPRTLQAAQNPPRLLASFAHDVLEAAKQGDASSRSLWHHAAAELARSAAAAAERTSRSGEIAVSTIGGLFGAGPLLTDAFVDELARHLPHGRWQPPWGDALDGAAVMATRTDLPHEGLVARLPLARHGRET